MTAKVADTSGHPHPANGVRKGERRGGRTKGTPNKQTADVRDLARMHGPAAIERAALLAGLVKGPDGNPVGMAQSEKAQVAALSIILDRAYGKPSQEHVVKGDANAPMHQVIELVIVDPSHGAAGIRPAPKALPV